MRIQPAATKHQERAGNDRHKELPVGAWVLCDNGPHILLEDPIPFSQRLGDDSHRTKSHRIHQKTRGEAADCEGGSGHHSIEHRQCNATRDQQNQRSPMEKSLERMVAPFAGRDFAGQFADLLWRESQPGQLGPNGLARGA